MEVEKGSAFLKDDGPFLTILGPSWGPIWASKGPLRLIFGLILGILTRKARKLKNEGPPMQNGHFWGWGESLKGPR